MHFCRVYSVVPICPCAAGVLFALKVLTTHYTQPGLHYALGLIPVPSRYIYWAELVLIQMITPNASFVGNVATLMHDGI